MQKNSIFEILMCGAIVALALAFLIFMRIQTGIGSLSSYALTVQIKRADGLDIGSDVRIAGVKVGSVTDMTLEPKTFAARVQMDVRQDLAIPVDSRATITQGMGSSAFLAITPGSSQQILAPGATLRVP